MTRTLYWIEIKSPGRLQYVVCPKTFTFNKEQIAKAFSMTQEKFTKRKEQYRIQSVEMEDDGS